MDKLLVSNATQSHIDQLISKYITRWRSYCNRCDEDCNVSAVTVNLC